jgi:hypothetical protein
MGGVGKLELILGDGGGGCTHTPRPNITEMRRHCEEVAEERTQET